MEAGTLCLPDDARNTNRMNRKRSPILTAQENYLKTRDNKYVEELYNNVVRLGMFILTRRGQKYQDPEDVRDLATDICLKLMEKGEPVISSAPSGYLSRALWYKQKPGMDFADIDEIEKAAEEYDGPSYDEVALKIQKEAGVDYSTELGALVGQTIESRINWHKVLKALPDKAQRRAFRIQIKEVEKCARESARLRAVAD